MENAPFMYFYDSYQYVVESIDIYDNGISHYYVGLPFIFLLGTFIKLFGNYFEIIFLSRIFNIFISIMLIIVIYLLSLKISNKYFAFCSSMLFAFEPIFLSYSIVPYNDIYAILMGLLAYYFTTFDKTIFQIISFIFFLMAATTRPELYVVLSIPIITIYVYKYFLNNLKINNLLVIMILYTIPTIWVASVVSNYTRFNVVEKIILFLKPYLILNVLNSVLTFYDVKFINTLFLTCLFLSICILLIKVIGVSLKINNDKNSLVIKYTRIYDIKSIIKSEKLIIIVGFCLIFILDILTLTLYGVNYTIVNDSLKIIPKIGSLRYLILPKLLINFLLAYPFSLIVMKILKIIRKRQIKIMTLMLTITLVVSSLYVFHINSMWGNAIIYSKDASDSLEVYYAASEWISNNLKEDEIAIVPMINVFKLAYPRLNDQIISYNPFWDSAGIIYRANTTNYEKIKVRRHLVNYLRQNSKVRYVIRDWVDPHAKDLYEVNVNDDLMTQIHEVKEFPLRLSTGWSTQITIYENSEYTNLQNASLQSLFKNVFSYPENVSISYNPNNVTIYKSEPKVSLYMPLDISIDARKQNYVSLNFYSDIEDIIIEMIFYYDLNKDGVFSGYDVDYVSTSLLTDDNSSWIVGDWNNLHQFIPKEDDLVTQIGMRISGDKNGVIVLSDFNIYTDINS